MSNLYKFKKSKEKSSRNKIIYDQRVHQRKTLRAIGEKYNLTRERVRQIVQSQKNRYEELPKIPKLMQDLPINTWLSLFLRRAKQTKTPIKKFISLSDRRGSFLFTKAIAISCDAGTLKKNATSKNCV